MTTQGNTIREHALRVYVTRQEMTRAKAARDAALEALDQERPNLKADVLQATDQLQLAELALRTLALAEYDRTGNKAPGPGVGIREVTRLEYSEPEALAWAVAHNLALRLDRNAFEKIVKVQPPPFVTALMETHATIATDLGKALGIEGAAP